MKIKLEIKITKVEDLINIVEDRKSLIEKRLLNALVTGQAWQQVRKDKEELVKLSQKKEKLERKRQRLIQALGVLL